MSRPLILVVGPAGFGKTTLLVEWLETADVASAWLTLDADDRDLDQFVMQLVFAVQSVFPGIGDQTLHALRRSPTTAEQLGAILGDELLDLPEDLILVLDDLHEIAHSDVHQFLAVLLHYPPPRLHLVIASRTDPPFALARQRSQGLVAEIRAIDLRFTVEETRALLALVSDFPVDEPFITLLQERIEGWVAGLHLVSMALHGARDPGALTETFGAHSDRHVMDFLIEEVLARQPRDVQEFLLRTSVVDRICGDLGTALLGDRAAGTAEQVLRQLARNELFVELLSNEPRWYRYHALFRELLRHRLAIEVSAAEVALLHRQASTWFAENGLVDEAVAHAVAGGDAERAADLIEQHADRVLARQEWLVLDRWLRMLPQEATARRPSLLMQQIRVARLRDGVFEGLRPLLRNIRATIESSGLGEDGPDLETLASEIALFEVSTRPVDSHVEEHLAIAGHALDHLAPHQRFARGRALYLYGVALQASHRTEEAVTCLNHELSIEAGRVDALTFYALLGLAVIHLREGNLPEVTRVAEYMLHLAVEHEFHESQAWARLLLGNVAYEQNEPDKTIELLSVVQGPRGAETALSTSESLTWLALAYQAKGMEREVEQSVERMVELVLSSKSLEYLSILHAFQARLSLLRGDRTKAIRWLDSSPLALDGSTLMAAEVPVLTRIKVLIEEGSSSSLDEASGILKLLSDRAHSTNEQRRVVETLALRAMLLRAQGNREASRTTLVRALERAASLRLMRTLIDLGPNLAALLRDVGVTGDLATYAASLLTAINDTSPIHPSRPVRQRFQVYHVLTEREAEVLIHLSRHQSNQQIADELFISPLTVKRHVSNIYDKLGVANRRQALIKADEMGLLPDDDAVTLERTAHERTK